MEGDSDTSLRSVPGGDGALFDTADKPDDEPDDEPDVLTDQERKTGRDANGQPLKGKKVTKLAQEVAAAWWDWIEPEGHMKPASSFIACRQVIKTALANGVPVDGLKRALVLITKEGRAVTGNSLTIALRETNTDLVAATPRRGEFDWDAAMTRAKEMDQMLAKGANA